MRVAIRQHLRALDASRYRHSIVYWNTFEDVPAWIRHFAFDAVVLHTTFLCLRWSHLFPFWKWNLRWIRELDCVKIALPQDEYDHSEVLDEWLHEWGVDVVFSNFDEGLREIIYPITAGRASFHKAFTGYIDEGAASRYAALLAPTAERPLDLVYRASHLPYWFGSHGQLKHRIADAFVQGARARQLRVDISTRESDTIVGTKWLDFLASGKAVLGCESGSSVLDRRGEVRAAIQYLLREDPLLSFDQVSAKMPPGWDLHQFFALSPRHFEAVITRTCQVLVEGRYDGVLEAGRHYIPLGRDLSNVADVLDQLGDADRMEAIAKRAYEEVYLAGRNTYKDLAARLDEILVARPGKVISLTGPVTSLLFRQRDGVRGPEVKRAPMRNALLAPASGWMQRLGRRRLSGESRPPAHSVRKWAMQHPDRFRIAVRAVMLDEPLRRLLMLHLRSRSRMRAATGQVLEELLILRLVREARVGQQSAGHPYRWDVVKDSDRNRLTIVSRAPLGKATGLSATEIKAALEDGPELYFDHGAIEVQVHHAVSGKRWVSLMVGPGPLHLSALGELSRLDPASVFQAIVDPLPKPGFVVRFLTNPSGYGARGYMALNTIYRERWLRRIWDVYLAHPGLIRRISPDRVMEDLLKLSIATKHPLSWVYHGDSQTLTMTTVEMNGGVDGQLVAAQAGGVKHLVWDNQRLGPNLLIRSHSGKSFGIHVGERSIHEFSALDVILAYHPEAVVAALTTTVELDRDGLKAQRPAEGAVLRP